MKKIRGNEKEGILVPPHKIIKTPEQIEGIREAGKLNTAVLDLVAGCIKRRNEYRRNRYIGA